jgi:phosphatidylserine decarboxylase
MAEKRQGSCTCPDGPHDAIDSRDLKYFRNVCGLSFRPEDEAARWRGWLPIARYGWAELLLFSFVFLGAGLIFAHLAYWNHPLFAIPLAGVLALWIFVISFFRDPRRTIPSQAEVVVSPADGTITHVGEVDEPDFSGGRALRVSIFLSVFNVHVNRVPRSGRVTAVRYYPGCFLDARKGECAVRNEQLWLDLEDAATGRPVRVKQIAGAIARRIVCWLRPGEEVRAGDRYGMIKFGSRTDLLVPPDVVAETRVKVGDKVRGGSTVLLRFRA